MKHSLLTAMLVTVLSTPVSLSREPFDFDKAFEEFIGPSQPEREPEPPAEASLQSVTPRPPAPAVSPDTRTLGPADFLPVEPEPPALDRRDPAVWLSNPDVFDSYTTTPQIVLFTSCGWNQRDRDGRFNSWCVPCNAANTAVERMIKQSQGGWTVGEDPYNDVWIVNVDSPLGRQVNLKFGKNGVPLTRLAGRESAGADREATPVFVVRNPHPENPRVISGWPPNLRPQSQEAVWYVASLLGYRRDTPEKWAASAEYGALASAVAQWAQYEGGSGRWGATVPVRDLIELAVPGGRRDLSENVTLIVPEDFRPIAAPTGTGDVRIEFRGAPRIEYRIASLIPKRVTLSHATVARDFSRVTLHVNGWRHGIPINLDWGTYSGGDYLSLFEGKADR